MAQFDLEVPEIPDEPTNADLARLARVTFEAARLTHDCLEQHRKTQEAGNLVFSSQLTAVTGLVDKVVKISDDNCKNIKTMTSAIRTISKVTKSIDKKAEEAKKLAEEASKAAIDAANDAASAAISGVSANSKLNNLNDNAWKFVGTIISGVLILGIAGVCGLAYQAATNQSSTVKAVVEATNTVVKEQRK